MTVRLFRSHGSVTPRGYRRFHVLLQNRVLNRRTTHGTRKTRHSNVTTTPLRADEAWARALI